MGGHALIALFAAVTLALPVAAQSPAFTATEPLASDTGQVLVEWDADGPVTLGIADADSTGVVRKLYSGENRSFFLSGLTDGDYVLVLGDDKVARAATIDLNVTQQSLTQALWLTLIGAMITLGIIVTIMRGARP